MSAGIVGWALGTAGVIRLAGHLATAIPASHHAAFLFDEWGHTTSYIAGALGGIWVSIATFRARLGGTAAPLPRWRALASVGAVMVIGAPIPWALWPWLTRVLLVVGVGALVAAVLVRPPHDREGSSHT